MAQAAKAAKAQGTALTLASSEMRRFDQVYDPIYTTSGYRDHARAMSKASNARMDRVPVKSNMFSEIPSVYHSHEMRVSHKNDLPSHVDASFRPPAPREARLSREVVSGANRHKYFRRPVVPVLHSAPPEVLLARLHEEMPSEEEQAWRAEAEARRAAELAEAEATGPRERATQTRLRESEAQTDPYTPEYVIPAGADQEPEILSLAHLTHKQGLPATMQEVELIERARRKKKFLATLPPITDEASFNLRKRMMEEQELLEFKYREQDIDRMQAEHLRLLRKAIEEREAEQEFVSEQRIEAIRQEKLDEKDRKLVEIQKMRIKQLRKLAKARANVAPKVSTHAIIDEYSRFASKTYAPVRRDGALDARRSADAGDSQRFLEDYAGLLHLEESVDPALMRACIKRPQRGGSRTAAERKREEVTKHLEWMDQKLRARRGGNKAGPASPVAEPVARPVVAEEEDEEDEDNRPLWRRRAEKLVRPPTPRVAAEDGAEADALDSAVTLLQQLLRGRAIQTMMYEGKMKRLELIRELRTTENQEAAEAAAAAAAEAAPAAESSHKAAQAAARKASEADCAEPALIESKQPESAAWDAIQGEVVSSTLDLLAKELVRMQQERRIFGVVFDANATRRRREMMQAGTRQAEQQRRDREDEVYRQLMMVHRGTVDSYFDELLADCVEVSATEQASMAVRGARPPSAKTEEGQDERSVVQNLVSSFLLPHVERESVRSQIEREERRFVQAAHDSIYEALQALEGNDAEVKKADA